MKRSMLGLSLIIMLAGSVWGEAQRIQITLDQAEKQALTHSPQLKAKQQEWRAARAKAGSQSALLWPKLSLEGSVNYVTEVPEFEIALPLPNAEPMKLAMGDNLNYSLGLQAVWNIWDSFAIRAGAAALHRVADAKQSEISAWEREVRLQTRLVYFQTQLALERVNLLLEALQLVKAQNRDIQAKAQVGASSRIDYLSSELDVIARKRQLREARNDLAAAIRTLLNLMGQDAEMDVNLPLGEKQTKRLPRGVAQPTIIITLDLTDISQAKLESAQKGRLSTEHPNLRSLVALTEAAQQMARSAGSGYWPQVYVQAKTSLDYPNGSVLEEVHQTVVSAAVSWPLWQNGRTGALVREQAAQVQAREALQEQTKRKLQLTWENAQDRFVQLMDVQKLNVKAVQHSEALAHLVYKAYQAGRVKYLEVQGANLRVLEASTQAAITDTQILIQLALLDSLS
ncbi:TolC family protein [bacterium]|nr:TolC family protein [bacterium]